MKKNKDYSFKKLLESKKFSVIFSIIVAFVVWMIIVINQTPKIDRVISNLTVNIDTTGTVAGELGLDEISGNTTKVTVKISGPAYIVGNLKETDLVVSPSLADVTSPGSYVIPLSASKLSFSDEFSVVSISPSQISLTFDYVDTKQMKVTPYINGISAAPGLVAEEPVISDADENTITVKGPRAEMQKLESVVAAVEAQEILSETKTYDASITLLDNKGNELDASKYTLSKSMVKVSVPISKHKVVPVVADFSNAPDGYQEFLKYNLSVNEISIIGPATTIDQINEVKLAPIDFFKISRDNKSFDMAPVLPDVVRILDNIEAVTVKIDTTDFAETTVTVKNVIASNNVNGYAIKLNSSIKNVRICGPKSVIRSLKTSSIYASVDLTGKSAGDYNAAIIIQSFEDKWIWQLDTYRASISIK